jgi:hypothetical protein
MSKTAVDIIIVKSCNECRHCKRERAYTADSFEYVEKFTCSNTRKPKVILNYVDWHEIVQIPKWCPLLTNK